MGPWNTYAANMREGGREGGRPIQGRVTYQRKDNAKNVCFKSHKTFYYLGCHPWPPPKKVYSCGR